MDADSLRAAVENAGFAASGIAFLSGLFFSFNPVALAAIPVSLAYVTKARETREAVWFGSMFIAGMITIHAVLGFLAGLGGFGIEAVIGRRWGLVLGPVLVLLGLIWMGAVRVPLPAISLRATRATSLWGAFGLGVPFSIAVCPFCTPALLVLLGVATALGSPLLGVTLLVAFALGRAVPIALGAFAVGWLENPKPLARYRRAFDLLSGVVLIVMGLYMLNAYFFFIRALAV